jgi:MFS family permease
MATTPNPTAPAAMSMAEVLRIPAMRRLWYAQIVSNFGDFLALFAVIGILTFQLGANPQQVTAVQIAYLAPIAILGVIAGVFVDRWPLKPTMVASDLTRAALVLLLLFATRMGHFYAVLAAISVVSSFFGPAQGVAIRSIVPLSGLRSANALMQQVMFIMRIVGPTVAALLVSSFGPKVCYWADAASFVASGALIATIALGRIEPPPAQTFEKTVEEEAKGIARIGRDMKVGFSFIFHHAGLLFVLLSMAAGIFVLACFGPLIAIYVRDSLHASNRIFGYASGAIGLGILLGMNTLNAYAKSVKNSLLVYSGLGGIAVGLLLLTLVPHVWSALLGDLIIGFAVAGIIVPSQTMIQQETPPALMGRVGSTVMSFISAAQVSGLILSGYLAKWIGVRNVFAVCAVMLVLLIGIGKLWMEPKEPAAA